MTAKLYAIREVADITGVKPVTLRAWQRRYHLIQPKRTEKGHRLYSEENIATIRVIQGWLAKGVSIGKVSALLEGSENLHQDLPSEQVELQEQETLLQALVELNKGKAESTIATVLKEYPLDIVEQQFVFPMIDALERVKGPLRTLHKGLFQSLMISKLSSIIESENKAATKGKCLCVSLDPMSSILAWLWFVSKSEAGYNVTVLDGVEDITALVGHEALPSYQHIAVFANRSLPDHQINALEKLQQQLANKLSRSEVICRLHTSLT
ncbi:MerR family transcriptional regulator [Vibrio aestuarianus]|uniref:MerR family transcriptional regulator n=1 Tax=Vibrio aestuarianus TaxID=28171 RepID=UPI00237CA386|nr:MerR family transcriptional regulator [Vibrio aestuarianus]MDE1328873.1 MerR family transcriptional regulator [Vibrio aestuarianus]